jgi:molybdate transport system regulatory protein
MIWMTVGGQKPRRAGADRAAGEDRRMRLDHPGGQGHRMSYKAAWDAIDAMNNLAGEPLVERLAGGKGGGGTRLTARGAQLVANFALIEREHRNFVKRLSEHAAASPTITYWSGR